MGVVPCPQPSRSHRRCVPCSTWATGDPAHASTRTLCAPEVMGPTSTTYMHARSLMAVECSVLAVGMVVGIKSCTASRSTCCPAASLAAVGLSGRGLAGSRVPCDLLWVWCWRVVTVLLHASPKPQLAAASPFVCSDKHCNVEHNLEYVNTAAGAHVSQQVG